MNFPLKSIALLALLTGLLAKPAVAQLSLPELLPPAMVKQEIGFTDLTIDYSRPAVKERAIFGNQANLYLSWAHTSVHFPLVPALAPAISGGQCVWVGW